MSSTQEAEQFIQSLSSYSILRRNHVEKSSKRLLFELLRYINGKTFATAKAVKATPFLTLKVYPGAIIAECNSDDLTKEDMHAICQPVDTEQNKAANFKTIVAATKRTHIESGNLSVEFQRSIFDLDNSLTMRRVWITPAQTVSTSTTRITLYLHDQGSKAEIQNLRNIIVSQFEDLEQESILFLGNIQSLKVEFREDDKMLRSRHFEKQTIDKYRVSVKTTTVDLEHRANLILAFPLTDDFKVEVGSISTKVLNLLPLAQGSLGFHIHSLLEVDDTTGVIVMSTHNIGIQNEIANVFFKAILQFCEHSILRYYWPLFIKNKPTEEDPFWGHLRIDVLNWISQNPVKANVLSEQCKHVLENCPDRFLGLIQHLWQDDGPHITKSPSLLSEIQQLPAKDLCGVSRPVKLRQTWFPLPHLQDIAKTYLEYPSEFPFLKIEEEKNMTVTVTTKWGFLTEYLGVKDKNSLEFLLQLLECIKHSWDRESIWQMQKIFELYSTIRKQFSTSSREEKKRAQEFFEASGILYMDETGPIWTGTSSCLWAAPPDMICRYSLKMFYEDKVVNTSALQGIRGLFCDALGIQNATAEDVVEEMCLLRDEGCEDLARITNNYAYLDNSIESSCSIRAAFGEQAVIFIQHDDISTWFSVKECSWSETETTPMECSLKRCYPGFKNFFLEKLGVRTSSYDKLVDFTSTDVEEAKKCLLSFMDESDALYEYDPELMAKVKIFPVQYPTSEAQPRPSIELCSLDTEFCIGDRDYLVKSLQSKVKMLSFSITEIRRLQPLFFWLSMEDRYLSECVEEMITGIPSSNFMPGDATAIEMALMNKAYQIARVAETFNSYGPYGNALSLYNMLRKLKVAKVDNMSIDLLLYQDDEVFTSRSSQKTIAYISEHIDSMAIYVNYDDNNEKLCLFSTLPRKLQQWLMQDLGSLCFEPFEVTNALTSIFACDVGILDDILDDQGMAQLSFENLDKVQSEPYTGAQQPRVDQDKALTLPVRER
ncbi:hypothetical protein FPSE5266_06898 [Fusarium pseudograminearum]|nr:hypothetical protein FPSE5266_06898 [Fusarium pseudograminearum]